MTLTALSIFMFGVRIQTTKTVFSFSNHFCSDKSRNRKHVPYSANHYFIFILILQNNYTWCVFRRFKKKRLSDVINIVVIHFYCPCYDWMVWVLSICLHILNYNTINNYNNEIHTIHLNWIQSRLIASIIIIIVCRKKIKPNQTVDIYEYE